MPTSLVLTSRGMSHPIPAGFDGQGELLYALGCSYGPETGTPPGAEVQLPWRSLWRSLRSRPTGRPSSLAVAPSTGGLRRPSPRLVRPLPLAGRSAVSRKPGPRRSPIACATPGGVCLRDVYVSLRLSRNYYSWHLFLPIRLARLVHS